VTHNFINSELCEIDGEKLIYFKHPLNILEQITKRLSEIGAEKFYSSPDQEIKKDRESLAELFFILAISKFTKRDWFLMQPVDPFPDCYLMGLGDKLNDLILEGVELTEIIPDCLEYTAALEIVMKKIKKGYPPNYNLLIFINNINSREWISNLNNDIGELTPFKSIWAVHLLANKDNTDILATVASRLRPVPPASILTNLREIRFNKTNSILEIFDVIKSNNSEFLRMKPEFVSQFKKAVSKRKIEKREK